MQLNLFQWDMIAVGSGYQALSQFEFAQARESFSRVLKAVPDHVAAGRGLEETQFWEEVMLALPDLSRDAALTHLWEKITEFSFNGMESHAALRRALLRHLLELFPAGEEGGRWYSPQDLCLGYLHLQLGEYAAAERNLRILLADFPEHARLHRHLGDALWRQGRQDAAHVEYVTALLLAPDAIDAESLCSRPLADLVASHGPALTPIEGYLAGLTPLVAPPAHPRDQAVQVYTLLRQSEIARREGRHQEMIDARRALKSLSPGILQRYLDWLAGL